MNPLFSKTLSVEPDHLIELTGPDEYLERDLVAYDFARVESEKDNKPKEPSDAADPTISKEPMIRVHLHVSSKHLTDASKYFRTAKQWKEKSEQAGESSKWHDTYVMAFVYLITILHGPVSSVIHEWVDLTRLYQICTLIDQLELHEHAKICTDLWFEQLEGQIPTEPSADIKKWLFITYVLKKGEFFTSLTLIVQRYYVSAQSAELSDAPALPDWILTRMKANQKQALNKCVTSLRLLIASYHKNKVCPYGSGACDAFTLGHLVLDLGPIGLWPVDQAEFEKRSPWDIYKLLNSIEKQRHTLHQTYQSRETDCGLHVRIQAIATTLWTMAGMTLPEK